MVVHVPVIVATLVDGLYELIVATWPAPLPCAIKIGAELKSA